jgi:hypothetical protein
MIQENFALCVSILGSFANWLVQFCTSFHLTLVTNEPRRFFFLPRVPPSNFTLQTVVAARTLVLDENDVHEKCRGLDKVPDGVCPTFGDAEMWPFLSEHVKTSTYFWSENFFRRATYILFASSELVSCDTVKYKRKSFAARHGKLKSRESSFLVERHLQF